MYDVPNVVLSFSKTPSTPSVAQGVLARDDVMTPRPVYIRCFTTRIVGSAWPVSVRAERAERAILGSFFVPALFSYFLMSQTEVLPL